MSPTAMSTEPSKLKFIDPRGRGFGGKLNGLKFKAKNLGRERFHCPWCEYKGPFRDHVDANARREHAQCPRCLSKERHRLQFLALGELAKRPRVTSDRVLHCAPEPFLARALRQQYTNYESADLYAQGVDHRVDLRDLPFEDARYDLVFASHVLEHIDDDRAAVREIHRVLRPGGIAILPVPIMGEVTVEYDEPNDDEAGHVRAPGVDYFERYRDVFAEVEVFSSEDFGEEHQTYLYFEGEWRSHWPPRPPFLRDTAGGTRFTDFVPVATA